MPKQVAIDASAALRHDVIVNFVDQMIWSTTPTGFHDYYNRRWYEFTGVPEGSTDGEAWNGMFHPDDQARAWAAWRHALETGEPYEIEYRLRHHSGQYRWVLGRAQCVRDQEGRILRWYGTCTDIHQARMTMELNDLLSRELSHRIKNIFAVISSLISLSARTYPAAQQFAQDIRARIDALGRAHEFVRPHSEDSRPQVESTSLQGMLTTLFKAYPSREGQSIRVCGDDVPVDDKGATAVALLFHELATNAVKYGALSCADGLVSIEISRQHDLVHMTWVERGGPPILTSPPVSGFGDRLTTISVRNQLGGTLLREWRTEGLVVRVSLPVESLVRTN